MTILFRAEIIAFLPIIIFLGLARRRGWLAGKQLVLIMATYLSIFIGTAALYASTDPVGQWPPSREGWWFAWAFAVVTWIMGYFVFRWVEKELTRRS